MTARSKVVALVPPKGAPRKQAQLHEKAWAIFAETPSKNAVAKGLKLDWRTAQAIVDDGYPDLGLEPLRNRYRRFMRGVAEETDAALRVHRAEAAMQLHAVRTKALGLLQRELSAIEKRATKGVVTQADKLYGIVEKSVRLERHLLGDSDVRVEHRDGGSVDDMSDDELAALILGESPNGPHG